MMIRSPMASLLRPAFVGAAGRRRALRNLLPNPGMSGWVAGTLGSGGSLPTGWRTVASAGNSWDILDGPPFGPLEIRVRGTANSTTNVRLQVGETITGAGIGDRWIFRANVQRVSGPALGLMLALVERNAAESFLTTKQGDSLVGSQGMLVLDTILTASAVNRLTCEIQFAVQNGFVADTVFRFWNPAVNKEGVY